MVIKLWKIHILKYCLCRRTIWDYLIFLPLGEVNGDPLGTIFHQSTAEHSLFGIGTIKTEGMICTCQGYSCSCIENRDAHCIWEQDGHCIDHDPMKGKGIISYFRSIESAAKFQCLILWMIHIHGFHSNFH